MLSVGFPMPALPPLIRPFTISPGGLNTRFTLGIEGFLCGVGLELARSLSLL